MGVFSAFVIGVGLSMDALAVAVASGVALKRMRAAHALKVAAFFGGFQAVMPALGWAGGLTFRDFISSFDHWIAFGLLVFIGGKMIYESFRIESDENPSCDGRDPCGTGLLFMLALATSIDALAVGLSFSLLKISILMPVLVIGSVTFVISFAGVYIGNRFGHIFENRIELAGGVILILIGLKILAEHIL